EPYNAQPIDLRHQQNSDATIARVQARADEGMTLESPTFRVHQSTCLKAILQARAQSLSQQPRQFHMQAGHHGRSPLVMFNCPVYRNQDHGRLGDKNAVADVQTYDVTRSTTADLVKNFNATTNCEKVTCLYNDVNWWIERLIDNPQELAKLKTDNAAQPDYFL